VKTCHSTPLSKLKFTEGSSECNTLGGNNKCIQNYSCNSLGYLCMESITILKCTLDKQIMKILIELAYFNIFYPNWSFGIEKTDKKILGQISQTLNRMLV
jgi:hypothetical protein